MLLFCFSFFRFCFLVFFLARYKCSVLVRNDHVSTTSYPEDFSLIFMSCGHSSKEQRDFLRENIRQQHVQLWFPLELFVVSYSHIEYDCQISPGVSKLLCRCVVAALSVTWRHQKDLGARGNL